jgi:mitochondrial enoyl-[acyl-carrier protein] reductase / trans-2-enoyl-CoA reductase
MKSLQISSFGRPGDVVELVELDEPAPPNAGEVLAAVEYAPIDPADLLMIRGMYGVKPALPAALGSEGVARVLAVGAGVENVRVGDRILIPINQPAWRERIVLPAAKLTPMPEGADPQQLSMLGVNSPTAALILSEYVDLKPRDWVIQNGGNSGVGRNLIAFARDRGLKTVSLVRREELVPELKAAGGDVVLVDGADAPKRIAEATGKARIRLAVDGVAGESFTTLTAALAPGGKLVTYGGTSGKPAQASPIHIIFKRITVAGLWLGYPEYVGSPRLADYSVQAARMVAAGKLKVPVAGLYPLSQAKEAMAHAIKGGKILFEMA